MTKHNNAQHYKHLQEVIVFIYEPGPVQDEEPSTLTFPVGTGWLLGFMTSIPTAGTIWGDGFFYIITNKHVIQLRGETNSQVLWKEEVSVRFNHHSTRKAIHKRLKLVIDGSDQNVFPHPNPKVDLVAIRLSKYDEFLPVALAYDMLTDKTEFTEKIRLGSNVCTVGYLPGYAGQDAIHPAMRFGRVSLLSDEWWWLTNRVGVPAGTREKAYVIEIAALGGCSGSPVLIDGRFEDEEHCLVVGVLKGSVSSDLGAEQGLAAIEPPQHCLELADILFEREKAMTTITIVARNQFPK